MRLESGLVHLCIMDERSSLLQAPNLHTEEAKNPYITSLHLHTRLHPYNLLERGSGMLDKTGKPLEMDENISEQGAIRSSGFRGKARNGLEHLRTKSKPLERDWNFWGKTAGCSEGTNQSM